MDASLRQRVSAALGGVGVNADASLLQPANLAQLREILELCAVAGQSCLPSGVDGALAGGDAVTIAVDRLDAVRLDASTLLIHAGGGAELAAVRQEAAAARLVVVALGSTRHPDVESAFLAGEIPARSVAGVDLLTRAGELISSGGRVLKDVVGFDLAGLALGSGRRLGAVAGVTLRLEPAAAATPVEPGPGLWRGGVELDLAAAFASRLA